MLHNSQDESSIHKSIAVKGDWEEEVSAVHPVLEAGHLAHGGLDEVGVFQPVSESQDFTDFKKNLLGVLDKDKKKKKKKKEKKTGGEGEVETPLATEPEVDEKAEQMKDALDWWTTSNNMTKVKQTK